ncbi:MAG TPA: ATP-dependent 6-phosphofructokinase [Candidatus Krumholzibacteria bacterium]|nr:ATP-dependent 6-phosphofructokinase [Candidatus Krumholzibacteria bacterium]
MKRIAIVTGGGDCPGLNATIRSVAKATAKRGWECVGIQGGYGGLLEPQNYRMLNYRDLGNLLTKGGTILGTASHGTFSSRTGAGHTRRVSDAALADAKRGFDALKLTALVCIGGDGTLTTAQQLYEYGIPVVGIPKTIYNDLDCTDFTFGFDSAVACATDAVDRLHTTAESHNRVMVLEVMGRYTGWIALYAGVAGGADVILIPEIPFTYASVQAKIRERESNGKHFTLVVVAEGACETGHDMTSVGERQEGEVRLGGIGVRVAAEVERLTGKEARTVVLGHLQRGGIPTAFDRALCTIFGVAAVDLIAAEDFGKMVAFAGTSVEPVPIPCAVERLKRVPLDGMLVRTARALGISVGD